MEGNLLDLVQSGGTAGVLVWIVWYFMCAIRKKDELLIEVTKEATDSIHEASLATREHTAALRELLAELRNRPSETA